MSIATGDFHYATRAIQKLSKRMLMWFNYVVGVKHFKSEVQVTPIQWRLI